MTKKTIGIDIRSSYYNSSDNLYKLLDQAKDLNDKELINSTEEAIHKLDEIRKTLDEKYLWD